MLGSGSGTVSGAADLGRPRLTTATRSASCFWTPTQQGGNGDGKNGAVPRLCVGPMVSHSCMGGLLLCEHQASRYDRLWELSLCATQPAW